MVDYHEMEISCNGCLSLKKSCKGCVSLTKSITDAEQTGFVFPRPTHCVCQTCLIKPICNDPCEDFCKMFDHSGLHIVPQWFPKKKLKT